MRESLQQIKAVDLIWQPDKDKMPVLNKISMGLDEGCFYGIMGPNGAGKTSLVKALLGVYGDCKGHVYLDNKRLDDYKRGEIARRIAYLPQNLNYSVDFTVYEMVAMGREPYLKTLSSLSHEDITAIEDALRFTDSCSLRDKSVARLSGGERQRVMIARTIAQDTPWIILDEPVSSLDVAHQTKLMQLMEKLRQEKKKTIVAILHDINLATAYCTHLVLMKDGKVYKNGKIDEVLDEKSLRYLYDMEFEFIEAEGKKMPYILPKYI